MRLTFLTWAFVIAAGIGASVPQVRAGDAPATMLVIDGSGSMWGRLPPDNRAKIDIIREKLGSVLQSSSATRVGLVSFGHRRRGDCNDVELIAPPSNERQAVLDPLAKLNPRGPGPVTAAIKAAVDAIGAARPAQVIVVGDNADNCVPDTCAVAKDIASKAPGVVIQVIGVGVPPAERPRLMCVAQETGGHYYDITDSTGLNAALDETTKLAILPSDAAPGPTSLGPAAPPPPEGGIIRASASLVQDGGLLAVPIAWRIFKTGDAKALQESNGTSISAKLAAGSYEIEAKLGGVSARQRIELVDGASENMTVGLSAAHLTASAASAAPGAPSPTSVLTVTSAGAPVAVARGGTLDLYLAPADYTITATDGAARAEKSLTLTAGDNKPLAIALGTGRLDIKSTGSVGAGDVLYTIYEDDPDSPNGRRRVARSHAPEPSFTLPAGTYYVSARYGAADTQQRIAVGAGETVKHTMALTAATLKLSTFIAGSPATAEHGVVYRVDRADGDHARIARAIGPDLALNVAAGRYQVTASLPAFRLSASQDITVAAGADVVAKLDIPSGTVSFKPPSGTMASTDVFWEVVDVTGNPVWRAAGSAAKAVLSPGHYTVRLDIRGKRRQTGFDVQAGQSQDVEIGPG